MSSAECKIIRVKLRRLLGAADLEMATQRALTKQLEADLGVPLDGHKALIKVGCAGEGVRGGMQRARASAARRSAHVAPRGTTPLTPHPPPIQDIIDQYLLQQQQEEAKEEGEVGAGAGDDDDM